MHKDLIYTGTGGAVRGKAVEQYRIRDHEISVIRVYDLVAYTHSGTSGLAVASTSVLIDRLWPRGISKKQFSPTLWLKDLTPSASIRKSLHAGKISWDTFKEYYCAELSDTAKKESTSLSQIAEALQTGNVALISAVKDVKHSHIPVLVPWIAEVIRN